MKSQCQDLIKDKYFIDRRLIKGGYIFPRKVEKAIAFKLQYQQWYYYTYIDKKIKLFAEDYERNFKKFITIKNAKDLIILGRSLNYYSIKDFDNLYIGWKAEILSHAPVFYVNKNLLNNSNFTDIIEENVREEFKTSVKDIALELNADCVQAYPVKVFIDKEHFIIGYRPIDLEALYGNVYLTTYETHKFLLSYANPKEYSDTVVYKATKNDYLDIRNFASNYYYIK